MVLRDAPSVAVRDGVDVNPHWHRTPTCDGHWFHVPDRNSGTRAEWAKTNEEHS